jgi:ClpP class serine protease
MQFVAPPSWRWTRIHLACRMAKKNEPVDELLDALVWMRRKAKRHQAVDDLIDALIKMRRKAKKKVAKQKKTTKKRAKSKG